MSKAMLNPEIAAMVRHGVEHARNGTMVQVDSVLKLPASNYTDPARFRREVDQIFRRLPLMLAASAELPNPGDYKSLDVVGTPVLIVRGKDGEVRAMVNSCSHRGANLATKSHGHASRFTCPYHGWTFSPDGGLIAVASAHDFGEIDKSCYGLQRLPCAERAGLIFVSLDADTKVSIDDFLAGYDGLLEQFGFKNWHFFASRRLKGPNWKIAYDGYLDYYHLPVLHGNSLGAGVTLNNRALYYAWGPHQKLIGQDRMVLEMAQTPEAEWRDEQVLTGVWTIFPCISIASFNGGGRGVMVSQLLPGETVGESWTTQIYLMEKAPDEAQAAGAQTQWDLLEHVVRDEDYATGLGQQRALDHGALKEVTYGRNEGGSQTFHAWVDRILAADRDQLATLFAAPERHGAR